MSEFPSESIDPKSEVAHHNSVEQIRNATQDFLSMLIDEEAVEDENVSYRETVKKSFLEIRQALDALPEEERSAQYAEFFGKLRGYFLAQERSQPGPDTFQLIDAHNAVVRDTDHPGFHQELMASLMHAEEEARSTGDSELLRLSLKAREFDANGKRRRGVALLDSDREAAMNLITEARETFGDVLHAYGVAEDSKSQARVLYELGFIAESTNDYRSAATVHEQSAVLADRTGDPIGAGIARMEASKAMLLSGQYDPHSIVMRLNALVREMRRFHQERGEARARDWVANGLFHLADAREAAGDLAGAREALQECLHPDFTKTDFATKLRGLAEERIAILSEKILDDENT